MAQRDLLQDSSVPDMYNCGVCLEHLQNRNPRFLSCHHYFCEECLVMLIKDNSIICPNCRKASDVPSNDVKTLQVNFLLVQMMERELQLQPAAVVGGVSTKCMFCHTNQAEVKCKECVQLLCTNCRTKHDDVRKFTGHVIQSLCKDHMDGISHICMKCCKEICVKCIVFDHKEHEDEILVYENGIRHIQSRMSGLTQRIQSHVLSIDVKKQQLKIEQSQLDKEKEKLIQENAPLIRQLELNNEKIRKIDNISSLYNDDVTALDKKKLDLEALYQLMGRLQGASGASFMQQFSFIQQRAVRLSLDTPPLENEGQKSGKTIANEGQKSGKTIANEGQKSGKTIINEGQKCGKTLTYGLACGTCHVNVCVACWKNCHSGHQKKSDVWNLLGKKCKCGLKGSKCQNNDMTWGNV